MEENKTPQNIEQYQEHYSESGLFSKIGKVCKKAGMKAIYYVLLLYYVLMDENTPWEHKGIIVGALGYFILPVDLIPDFIPVAGYTDDVAALTACIKTVMDNITPSIKKKALQKLTDWFVDVEYSKVEEYDAELEE
jgi:uncharacterized membrane protein YkvA (DUF1232 family)